MAREVLGVYVPLCALHDTVSYTFRLGKLRPRGVLVDAAGCHCAVRERLDDGHVNHAALDVLEASSYPQHQKAITNHGYDQR